MEYNKISILLVDDETELTQDLAKSIDLSAGTYNLIINQIVTASDGNEAITKIKNQFFDIIILDYDMPKRNGKEVLNFILDLNKKQTKKIHVIFVSGKLDSDIVLALKEAKVLDVITKPFKIDRIMEKISKLLSH